MAKAEFDLIEAIKSRLTSQPNVVLGVGDDAALLRIASGQQCVITTDTLVSGRHFDDHLSVADIGHKSLAVNLSDLAAMGAEPCAITAALTLPSCDPSWVHDWLDGLLPLATAHQVSIIGGDTTQGPLSITITAIGQVPEGQAITRAGATIGDDLWVTGTLGDARAALRHWQDVDDLLRIRLTRPTPRIHVGLALRNIASACLDLSDGLLGDVEHILRASGVGVRIDAEALPVSSSLNAFSKQSGRPHHTFALTGGDDYELCFTAAVTQRSSIDAISQTTNTPITRIGRMVEKEQGLLVVQRDGSTMDISGMKSHEHFAH